MGGQRSRVGDMSSGGPRGWGGDREGPRGCLGAERYGAHGSWGKPVWGSHHVSRGRSKGLGVVGGFKGSTGHFGGLSTGGVKGVFAGSLEGWGEAHEAQGRLWWGGRVRRGEIKAGLGPVRGGRVKEGPEARGGWESRDVLGGIWGPRRLQGDGGWSVAAFGGRAGVNRKRIAGRGNQRSSEASHDWGGVKGGPRE